MHSISISEIRLNIFSAELTSNNALTDENSRREIRRGNINISITCIALSFNYLAWLKGDEQF